VSIYHSEAYHKSSIDQKITTCIHLFLITVANCFNLFLFKEVCQHLKQVTDSKGSIAMVFATDEGCTVVDMQKRSEKTKMAKGLKVLMSLFNPQLVEKIKGIIY